ncbi:Proteasomal ATPase-associated factor 1 [Dermatophagoides pteronyssinus]|uniref:Proteasomal ATPase-associated factor 1 n=1 Tax=Dermatophagoides pteronyssinus TaxID=6956 RepID=A0ABQ8J3L7_DERPT|nr:Proteasomal ATPase-associated factor 1 [Dermatophagoides pteronyssinus]
MTFKINFPNYHLQSDWHDASINEKIWLHSINIKNDDRNDDLKKNYDLKIINESNIIIDNDKKNDDNDFIIEDYSKKCLAINDVKSNVTHRFIAPVRVFQSIHQKSIISLDVAPTGIAVSSSTDGTMKIWDTCTNVLKYELKGHYLDVNRCRFFPSNEVIVSVGLDMLIKIWSAIDGSCPVTMKGHTGSINDLAIVDRGRNIITVGRDGLAKLWSCAKQTCIENLFDTGNIPINACAIKSFSNSYDLGQRKDSANDDCVGTLNKMLLLATESGSIHGIGVDSKQSLFKIDCHSPVNCVSFLNEFDLIAGTHDGNIYQYDIRNFNQPKINWLISRSPVLSMISVRRPFNGFVVSHQDGSVDFHYDNHNQILHLTGSDCDPIYQIVYDDKFIYTACRDGKVRKYYLNNAFE